jgi:hypothetical protein
MFMTTQVQAALRLWATAKRNASENTRLILRDSSDATMRLCAERMKILQEAENVLLTLDGADLPEQLVRFKKAEEDRGCCVCWVRSDNSLHPECRAKINEFFRAQDNLMEFALMFTD